MISTPIDPMDIIADLQFFQESNFTSKMFNSPQYRQFYTELFHSMNAPNRLSCHIEYQNEWFLSDPTDHEHLSAYSWFEKWLLLLMDSFDTSSLSLSDLMDV